MEPSSKIIISKKTSIFSENHCKLDIKSYSKSTAEHGQNASGGHTYQIERLGGKMRVSGQKERVGGAIQTIQMYQL